MHELNITLMIDDQGKWIICKQDDDALAIWEEANGSDVVSSMATYALALKVSAPKPIPLMGVIPEPTNSDKPVTLTVS